MGSVLAKASSAAIVAVVAAVIGTCYHHSYTSESIVTSYHSCLDNLDDYLLIEIFHRLPLKSVFQCKLVSKRWNSLISSPYFVTRFGHNQPNKPFALIFNPNILVRLRDFYRTVNWPQNSYIFSKDPIFKSRPSVSELNFIPCFNPKEPDSVRITASYDDLLLCQDTSMSEWTRSEQQYCVCNLLTKHWVVLPPYPDENQYKIFYVGLVYNHLVEKKDSIRVVRILQDQSSAKSFEVMIYSSKRNLWTKSLVSHPYKVDLFQRRNILEPRKAFGCNATLHWLTAGNDIFAYNPYRPEKCWLIKKPIGFYCYTSCLGVCQGTLQLARIDAAHRYGYAIRTWQLGNYDTGEWLLKNELLLEPLVSALRLHEPELARYMVVLPKLLAVDPNDRNIVYMTSKGCVLSCNFEARQLQVEDRTLSGLNILNLHHAVFQLVIPIWPTTSLPPLPIKYALNWPVVSLCLLGAGSIISSIYCFYGLYQVLKATSEVLDSIAKIVNGAEPKKKSFRPR